MSATLLENLVVQVKKQFDVVGSYELSPHLLHLPGVDFFTDSGLRNSEVNIKNPFAII